VSESGEEGEVSARAQFDRTEVSYNALFGRVYVIYGGHEDKSSLYDTLFHCSILSKHHHHNLFYFLSFGSASLLFIGHLFFIIDDIFIWKHLV
jgi:hypothetical protein